MLRRRPLLRTAATTAVVAGTATAVSGRVARRQQARAERAPSEAAPPVEPMPAYAPEAPAPAPAPAAGPTTVDQLTQLAALHAQGVLTDAEFDAAKAKILAG